MNDQLPHPDAQAGGGCLATSTATVSFVCNALGGVRAEIVCEAGCGKTAQRNALAIDRVVRLTMNAPAEHRAAIERALNDAEKAIRERFRR